MYNVVYEKVWLVRNTFVEQQHAYTMLMICRNKIYVYMIIMSINYMAKMFSKSTMNI